MTSPLSLPAIGRGCGEGGASRGGSRRGVAEAAVALGRRRWRAEAMGSAVRFPLLLLLGLAGPAATLAGYIEVCMDRGVLCGARCRCPLRERGPRGGCLGAGRWLAAEERPRWDFLAILPGCSDPFGGGLAPGGALPGCGGQEEGERCAEGRGSWSWTSFCLLVGVGGGGSVSSGRVLPAGYRRPRVPRSAGMLGDWGLRWEVTSAFLARCRSGELRIGLEA